MVSTELFWSRVGEDPSMSAFAGQLRAECTLLLRDRGVLTFALFFPVPTVLFFGYLNRGSA